MMRSLFPFLGCHGVSIQIDIVFIGTTKPGHGPRIYRMDQHQCRLVGTTMVRFNQIIRLHVRNFLYGTPRITFHAVCAAAVNHESGQISWQDGNVHGFLHTRYGETVQLRSLYLTCCALKEIPRLSVSLCKDVTWLQQGVVGQRWWWYVIRIGSQRNQRILDTRLRKIVQVLFPKVSKVYWK